MNECTIFINALEKQNPAERLAYLTEACGTDGALRAQVEMLLRENEQLGGFLESPASQLASLKLPTGTSPGCSILQELGDFRIVREIGRGGMGIVYEAEQVSLGRRVALKVLPALSILDPKRLQRFEREAKAAARLHHTNIVPIYGVGEEAALHYIAMQFIAGRSLDHVLRAMRKPQELGSPGAVPVTVSADQATTDHAIPAAVPVSPIPVGLPSPSPPSALNGSGLGYYQDVARLGLQVAEALEYAARQGVLHRDIKPANLMLDDTGQVWVMDFGLAKLADSDDLTRTGELVGTLQYMAPERFQDRFDARSDVYSLGLTLYELLTLRPAYDESDRGKLVARILNSDPPRPRRFNGAIPLDLETIVLKAISREPQGRYATAGELAEDLRRFLADRQILARRISMAERWWRFCRRNPSRAALIASVVVLGLAVVAISSLSAVWLGERATRAEIAEHKAEEQLWISKRDQARAMRMSRRPGQRIESLRVIKEAMQLPVPPGYSLAELRTEVIAALALPDIEVERSWRGGLTTGIVAVAFSRNLRYYARLAEDGTVTVSQVSDNLEVATPWREESDQPWVAERENLGLSPDGRFVYLFHAGVLTVRKWDAAKPVLCYQTPQNGFGCTDAICFTPDSSRLVYIAEDTRSAAGSILVVVDLESGRASYLSHFRMRSPTIQCAPDSRRIAIAGVRDRKMTVEIRELRTGRIQTSFLPEESRESGAETPQSPNPGVKRVNLEWYPDGNTLATVSDDPASTDHRIHLWDVSNGKLLRTFEGHKAWGVRCSFDSSGSRLLSNDWSENLRLWEPSSGRQLLSFPSGGYNIFQVAPDDRLAAMPFADSTELQVLRLHGNGVYRSLGSNLITSVQVVVHPEGRLAAVGTDSELILMDLATGWELGKLPITDRPLRWNSDGTLLTAGESGLLGWPVQVAGENTEHYRIGPPKRLLELEDAPRAQWGISDDARTVALPDLDRGAILIQLGSPPTTKPLALLDKDLRQCSMSPNGEWVAAGSHISSDGSGAKIWKAATGRLEMELPVPGRSSPVFSPDGRWLLTNSGGCRLWRVGTWTEGPKIGGAWGCFSPPDGKFLAVEYGPGAVRLVETETGVEVVRLESPEQSRTIPQCFSPDGTRLIAWGPDTGSLHVWDLRLLRQELALLGLDWSAPPYPPAAQPITPTHPLQLEVLVGDLHLGAGK